MRGTRNRRGRDRSWLRVLAVSSAVMLVAAACGDDGDDAASDAPETTAETPETTTDDGTGEGAGADPFCSAGPAVDAALAPDEPDPAEVEAALSAAEAAAPESIADAVATAASTVRAIFDTGDFSLFEGEDFQAAIATIDAFYLSDCGYADVGFGAVEYEYTDVAASIEAGPTVLGLTNNGAELHEAFVARINDDVELSAEELIMLPEEEGETMVTETAFLFAFPGTSDTAAIDLEPGRYLIACFIPIGTTPDVLPEVEAAFESGDDLPAPHFTEGMVTEVEVT